MTAFAGIRIRIMMIVAGIYGADQAYHTSLSVTRPNQPSWQNTKSKFMKLEVSSVRHITWYLSAEPFQVEWCMRQIVGIDRKEVTGEAHILQLLDTCIWDGRD